MRNKGCSPVVKLRGVCSWTPRAETESPGSREVGRRDTEETCHPLKCPRSSVFYRKTIKKKSFTDKIFFFSDTTGYLGPVHIYVSNLGEGFLLFFLFIIVLVACHSNGEDTPLHYHSDQVNEAWWGTWFYTQEAVHWTLCSLNEHRNLFFYY